MPLAVAAFSGAPHSQQNLAPSCGVRAVPHSLQGATACTASARRHESTTPPTTPPTAPPTPPAGSVPPLAGQPGEARHPGGSRHVALGLALPPWLPPS